jgi:hypothetical protein
MNALLAQLLSRSNLPEPFAQALAEVISLPADTAVSCLTDPGRVLVMLEEWVASEAFVGAVARLNTCVHDFLLDKARSNISNENALKVAETSIGDFSLSRAHFEMIRTGNLIDLFKAALSGAAGAGAQALDMMTAGIQGKLSKGVEKVMQAEEKLEGVLAVGGQVAARTGGSELIDDALEAVMQVGEAVPFAGEAVKLIHTVRCRPNAALLA